jgi:sterol desaturase/sphingolipid hydroxylase (fatty acid hydroxylase superfamily)
MEIAWHVLTAGLSALVLFLMFRPLEVAYPAKSGQRVFRPQWWTDLCFLLGQYLVFNGAVLWVLELLSPWIRASTPDAVRTWVGSLNVWVQLPLVILTGDFLIYWGHRLQHRIDLLWRFHSIHHSSEHLDWLAAHREHPVDSLYTILLVNLPIFALGVPVKTLAYFAAFRGLWAIFVHANVRLPIGPLRMLIGAPELHHWHHDRSRDAGNYANVSPLMDLVFGTYRCPDHEPERVGVEEAVPKGYLGQLVYPFWRRGRRERAPSVKRTGAAE